MNRRRVLDLADHFIHSSHESVYRKARKPVRVGDVVYESLAAAAIKLRCTACTVKNLVKKGILPDGRKIEFVKKD
jgi:hypothetical protein